MKLNKLFVFLVSVIVTQTSSFTFDCEYQLIKMGKIQLHYNCIATTFGVQKSAVELAGIGGNHKENKTNQDIGILVIENKTCHYLPRNMQNHLPKLYHLDIKNTGLKAINVEDMKMFPRLKYLYIRNNLIETLPVGLFSFNQNLQFINLNDNLIRHVAEFVFDNLPELININIERNVCIDDNAFGDIKIKSLKSDIASKCPL